MEELIPVSELKKALENLPKDHDYCVRNFQCDFTLGYFKFKFDYDKIKREWELYKVEDNY